VVAAPTERWSWGCLIAALCLAAWGGLGGVQIPSQIQLALAGGAVALAGLPHGAADGWLALQGGIAATRPRAVCFFAGYLGLAVLVVVGWNALPVICLGVFLAISVWHFGDGRIMQPLALARIASGLVVLGAPVVMSGTEVTQIYQVLSGPGAMVLAKAQWLLFWPACMVVVVAAFIRSAQWRTIAPPLLEHVALVGLAGLLSPLMYFVVFFCGIHSPRHMSAVLQLARTGARRLLWGSVWALTLISIAAGGLVFLWLIRSGQPPEAAAQRVIFIGLAALTLPHMVWVDGLYPWMRRRVTGATSLS